MKVFLCAMMLAVLTLSGCASTGTRAYEADKVKCPACGYEFNQPAES